MVVSFMIGSDRPIDDESASDSDDVIRAEWDWTSRAPSTAIVQTVAVAADAEPTSIEPLYESVDPDALDRLVRSYEDGSTDVVVTFPLAGHEVTVHGDGEVVVSPVA